MSNPNKLFDSSCRRRAGHRQDSPAAAGVRCARAAAHAASIAVLAVAGFACLLVAAGAGANVFVKDGRVYRDPTLPIFRSVGLLTDQRRQVGTAFLVGECHVMTTYHSAFLPERGARLDRRDTAAPFAASTLLFHAGADRHRPGRFATRTRARVVDFGNYHPGTSRGMRGDWAILRLDECLGRQYGWLPILPPTDGAYPPAGPLMTVSFPLSARTRAGVAVESPCHARDRERLFGLVAVDCAFEAGMSGGPILERQANGQWWVVGMIQLRHTPVVGPLPAYSRRHRNQMLHAAAFLPAVQRLTGHAGSEQTDSGADPDTEFEQAALALALADLTAEIRRDPDATVSTWRGDLNGDAVSELVFRLCGRNAIRADTCTLHVIERGPGGTPRRAGRLPGAAGPVHLGYHDIHGWRPLIVGEPGQRWQAGFDGGAYQVVAPPKASSPADSPSPSAVPAGEDGIMHVEVLLNAPAKAPR